MLSFILPDANTKFTDDFGITNTQEPVYTSPYNLVVIADGYYVYYSEDGITWNSSRAATYTDTMYNINYSEDLQQFIIGPVNGNVIYTSHDLQSWTKQTITVYNTTSIRVFDIIWIPKSNKYFIGTDKGICTSTDGITYVKTPFDSVTSRFAYNPKTNMILNSYNSINGFYTTDEFTSFKTLPPSTLQSTKTMVAAIYADKLDLFIMADGKNIITTRDGTELLTELTMKGKAFTGMAYSSKQNKIVLVDGYGLVVVSTDGVTFTSNETPFTSSTITRYRVAYASRLDKFFAVRTDGNVFSSSNGIDWDKTSKIPTTASVKDIKAIY